MALSKALHRRGIQPAATRNDSASQADFVEGAIVRIKAENFLTYDSVEFHPGSKLNVIIGPNGSGKSTIVCAICLGLGGKTSIIGRATQVSEYIKHGTNKANLEIELYKSSPPNYVISREIRRDNTSSWMLNHSNSNQKTIDELMMKLNIQVGNLCQFLPQDRVADFVKMTQQELLINTEKAVGSPEMYSNHMELKKLSVSTRDLQQNYENSVDRIKKEQLKNSRLEDEVKNYRARQSFLDKIELLQKKKPWVEYDEARKRHTRMKDQYDAMNRQFKELEQRNSPLFKELQNCQNRMKKVDDQLNDVGRRLQATNEITADKRRGILKQGDKVTELQEILNEKKSIEIERLRRLQGLKNQLDGLKNELNSLPDNNNEFQTEIDLTSREITVCANQQVQIQTDISNAEADVINLQQEIKRIEQELKQVQDFQSRRLELLRQKNKNAYEAVMWLRENSNRFQKRIYEPIMVLINVQDPKMAKYIEAHIPYKDLFLFVCEDSQDMEEFLRVLRDQRHLQINVALVPSKPLSAYQPRTPIQHLHKFGFHHYLKDLISAPDSVLTYLCNYYKIHDIPVGDNRTKGMVESVFKETSLQNFYTENHHYISRRSKYNSQVYTRNQELTRPTILTSSVDMDRVYQLTSSLKTLKASHPEKTEICKQKKDREKEIINELERLRNQKKDLTMRRDRRKNFLAKISQKEESIRRCELEAINLDSEEEKTKKMICDVIHKKCVMFTDYTQKIKECLEVNKERIVLNFKKIGTFNDLTKTENQFKVVQGELIEQKRRLTILSDEVKDMKLAAKQLFNNACKVTGIHPNDKLPPDLQALFAQCPETIAEIDAMIHETQAQADCLLQTDENVIYEYNKRKKEIAQLEKSMEDKATKLEGYKADIERIRQIWLPSLEDLIQRINQNFSKYFHSLGCAGEVSINDCGNEEDYDKYGICIKVKYRDSEQLRELSPYQQSGGERSVATVLYMMALQELTNVPFRCVDEINQGMDSANERKVFELMVQISCHENTAQYFLLTPKLLPDLEYSDNMTVLCVYNGSMVNHTQWNLTKFLSRRRKIKT